MKRTREFNDILNQCLERILVKGETIEQCLASYPEQAAELKPLLKTALLTEKVSALQPRPEFRARARYQFQTAIQEMTAKKSRRFFIWQPRWATAVITTITAFVLVGSGTVATASNSMPDQRLYPVKLATERARLALTPSALGKAELYLRLTDKRIAEVVYMANKGKPAPVEQVAQRLNTHLAMMARLTALKGKEPATMMAPMPGPRAEMGPPERAKKAEAAKLDKRAKLKIMVMRKALTHPEVLRAALLKVPESVKPALRRALAATDEGYEKALRALE